MKIYVVTENRPLVTQKTGIGAVRAKRDHFINNLLSQATTLNPKYSLILLLVVCTQTHSQSRFDSLLQKIDLNKWSLAVSKKMSQLENKILAKSEKALRRLQKQEEKIFAKQLASKDSNEARPGIASIEARYKALTDNLRKPATTDGSNCRYLPHLDSLESVFRFMNENGGTPAVKDALAKIESFDNKLKQAEAIKEFIRDRRDRLKQQLGQLGFARRLKKINEEAYYYSERLKEFRDILSHPGKMEKKITGLLSNTKVFQDFMKKNSMLAALFRIPDDPNAPGYLTTLAGLQARAQVNSMVQQQVISGAANAQTQFQQGMQQAQSQIQMLKDKFLDVSSAQTHDGAGSDELMPEGFKPNNQRTKSFFKRLEYGTNFQTQKANNFFPVTTDLGLSLGYKLNDRSVVGIGASCKLGLGSGWNHIQFSSQGAGIRSYIDWKIKGNFWMSGGYELNYRVAFNNLVPLQNLDAWQQSGLIGFSKVIAVKSRFFRKTKLQLLWDVLSYRQVPRTQSITFRVGYNWK